MTFKVGDLVKLKSGGPDMAVSEVLKVKFGRDEGEPTGDYTCQWFAGKKLDRGTFPEASLVKVSD